MKKLVIFAGPNGSGKSTISKGLLTPSDYSTYVNADVIQTSLGLTEQEAAIKAEEAREKFLAQKSSFTFETVLSTSTNFDLIIRAKNEGYYIVCYYVLTINPQININRVATRSQKGEHYISPEKTYYRYIRSLTLMPILISICDELYVYDNSLDIKTGCASLILYSTEHHPEIYKSDVWSIDMIKSLCLGKYPTDYILKSSF